MKARVKLVEGMRFVASAHSSHTIVMDSPPRGEKSLGSTPMETVLMALGGCTALDIVWILRKMRQRVADLEVRLDAERARQDPKVFTKVHIEYIVKGEGVSRSSVERAILLSQEKYCSVGSMLKKGGVEIATSFKVEKA